MFCISIAKLAVPLEALRPWNNSRHSGKIISLGEIMSLSCLGKSLEFITRVKEDISGERGLGIFAAQTKMNRRKSMDANKWLHGRRDGMGLFAQIV